MSHSTVSLVLASAVATSGTFTVSYPSGKGKGNFINGSDHRMVALQKEMFVGKEFTISFGDTAATITYLGSTTIPASSTVRVQLDEVGEEYRVEEVISGGQQLRPVWIDLGSPATADADGILNDASATDSATSYDSSDFVTGFDGTLDVPRNLTATGTAGSNHVVTVTGEDVYGNTMVEALTLSGTSVISGVKAFKKVTSVAVAAGAASDTFDLGWGDVLGLPFFLKDTDQVIAEYENSDRVSGGAGKVFLPFEYGATQINAGTSWELVCPVHGEITRLRSTIQTAFTTGGDVTVEVNTTAVDGLSMAVGTDAAGVRDTDTPTAGHASTVVAPGDRIEVIGSAAFDSAGAINGVLEIRAYGTQNGTYVVGSQAQATATSGDVRGTFDPDTACDGVTSFALVALVDNANYLGAPQYAG